jgi:hypothetical protein
LAPHNKQPSTSTAYSSGTNSRFSHLFKQPLQYDSLNLPSRAIQSGGDLQHHPTASGEDDNEEFTENEKQHPHLRISTSQQRGQGPLLMAKRGHSNQNQHQQMMLRGKVTKLRDQLQIMRIKHQGIIMMGGGSHTK